MNTLKQLNEVVRGKLAQSISSMLDRINHLTDKHERLTDRGLSLSTIEVQELKQKQEELARHRRLQQTLGIKQ